MILLPLQIVSCLLIDASARQTCEQNKEHNPHINAQESHNYLDASER